MVYTYILQEYATGSYECVCVCVRTVRVEVLEKLSAPLSKVTTRVHLFFYEQTLVIHSTTSVIDPGLFNIVKIKR